MEVDNLIELSKSEDNGAVPCDEDYVVVVDVSKAAVLQRAMKWAGLKPVSSAN